MNESFLVSHLTGNTFSRALLEELEKRGSLHSFHTTLGLANDSPWKRFLPPVRRHRSFPVPRKRLRLHPLKEIRRLGTGALGGQERRRRLADASYFNLDQAVARTLSQERPTIVHAYEDGADATFRMAGELGIFRSYELPIAYWTTTRRLLMEEAERLPDWEPTLEATREPEEKLIRKTEEIHRADAITCPSDFVLESIPAEIRAVKPCLVASFGSPSATECPGTRREMRAKDSPLRVLFVGSMSQRKGLADLFKAIRLLNTDKVELIVLGAPSLPMNFYQQQLPNFTHHPSAPRREVLEVMRSCDVFALPSIIEGRALVQQEAMSQGLPLIVTTNAGGDDLIDEGHTGFLVPIRSPEVIAEKLEWFLRNRDVIPAMREEAALKAASYSWSNYARSIIDFCLRQRPSGTTMQAA